MNGKWLVGTAFLVGAILTNSSVMASNTSTLPATVEVQEKTLAYTLQPVSLVFSPLTRAYDTKNLVIENTGEINFYPSVQFTNHSDTELVSGRGLNINNSDKLHFKIGNKYVDTQIDSVYPNDTTPVQKGETATIPLSVGAGASLTKEAMNDYKFDVHLVVDQFMDKVNITKIEASDTSVDLEWDAYYREGTSATRYRVTVQKLNQETGQFENFSYGRSTSGTTFTYTGLQPGNTYIFEVTPQFDLFYQTKHMGTIQGSTPSSEEIGEEFQLFNVENLTYTVDGIKATFNWEGIPDIDRYRLVVSRKASPTDEYVVRGNYAVTDGTYTATLTKGYYYKAVVRPLVNNIYDEARQSNEVEFHIPN